VHHFETGGGGEFPERFAAKIEPLKFQVLGWIGRRGSINQGLLLSRSPYVLVSNPDIVYRPGAVDALLDVLERRPRAAFAIARLVRPDGTPQTSVGDLPTLGEALLGRWWQRRRSGERGFWWDGWDHDAEVVIGHGMEACYLVRRSALADIGPQDERFPLDWEGIDWSARVAEAGWEVWFSPAAEVVHLGGVSLRQAQLRWVLRSHQGMYRYFAKRRPPSWRPALAAAFAVRGLVKGAAIASGRWSYRHSEPTAVDDGEPR
jgi:GT2 family glycosyltransferase